MRHAIDQILMSIFQLILKENKSSGEWSEVESDDMFQKEPYVGGYDADEEAFCFSYFSEDGEYWFQVTLGEIEKAVEGELLEVELVEADLQSRRDVTKGAASFGQIKAALTSAQQAYKGSTVVSRPKSKQASGND